MTSPRCKSQQRMGSDVSRVSKAAAQLSLEPFSSATRQIVAGRIIEADTIEGFIFRALGARRGEGSSITRAEETIPTLPYLTWVVEGCGALGRKLVPHECPDRFLPVAWKNSIHRQLGNRACPSALLSSPLSSPSFFPLPFPPRTRLRTGVENFKRERVCIREERRIFEEDARRR